METCSAQDQQVCGSNLRLVKTDTLLPTAGHHCNIFLKEAVLPGRNDTEMGPANSLHALVRYSNYNERFDLHFEVDFYFVLRARNLKENLAWTP